MTDDQKQIGTVIKKLKTVSLVVDDLLDCKESEAVKALIEIESDISSYACFLRHIRNQYGLWQENEELARDCLKVDPEVATATFRMYNGDEEFTKSLLLGEVHPDDASVVVFNELRKRLKCFECDKIAIWHRITQFSGTHKFCDECAKEESDFGNNDSYAVWVNLIRDNND